MSWGQVWEKKVLDVIGGTTLTAPANVWIALFTAAPTDSGGGTEVTGGSYARLAVTNNSTNFPAASGGTPSTKSNGVDFNWPTAPTANWGTPIVAWAVMDAVTAGNIIRWALLTTSKNVQLGDPAPKFLAGQLSLTEN